MSGYSEQVARYLRREILLVLAADTDFTCNESLLRSMLIERGFRPSSDLLRAQLAWLAEQWLVRTREVGDLVIATVLQRGVDVTTRAAIVPGIELPDAART